MNAASYGLLEAVDTIVMWIIIMVYVVSFKQFCHTDHDSLADHM